MHGWAHKGKWWGGMRGAGEAGGQVHGGVVRLQQGAGAGGLAAAAAGAELPAPADGPAPKLLRPHCGPD